MKPFFSIPALIFGLMATLCQPTHAQELQRVLPASTEIPHYLLAIAYNTTTVLVFPSVVNPVDRGDRDVLAQKQPGVENVLKLKAARKNFPATNLHVFTADGKIYAFDIVYTDSLGSTRDLRLLDPSENHFETRIIHSGIQINSDQMAHFVGEMKHSSGKVHGPSDRDSRMSIRMTKVGLAGSLLFFRLHVVNKSNLDYQPDFLRLYVRDRRNAKRTSVQEREMIPEYQDSLTRIPGDSASTYVVAIPTFSLSHGKEFIMEMYEKNGGRNLTLLLKNKILFKATRL